MSKDMDLVVSIGGIADPSLGKAFETVKARLDSLQERSRQASSLRDVLGDAIRLERELADMRKVGDRGVAEHARQLGERQEQLKRLGIEARAAGDAYARLGEMQRGLDMQARGLQRLEQASQAMPLASAFSGLVVEASKTAAGYQARLRDLAIRNGLDVGREPVLASLIQDSANQSGLGRTVTLDMLEHLNATGMGFAAAQMNLDWRAASALAKGLLQPRLRGWFERCNWPRVRTRQSNCPPPSTAWSSWVKAESAVRPWRVACLPCCQRWAMRERPRPAMSVHWVPCWRFRQRTPRQTKRTCG